MTNTYFESMMNQLQEALRGYAFLHPEASKALNLCDLRERDPTVERLLEGVAYLCGEAKRLAESDLEEMTQMMICHLSPGWLDPLPSFTVVEFKPQSSNFPKPFKIPVSSSIQSKPVGPDEHSLIPCRFSTEADLWIYPLQLVAPSETSQNSSQNRREFFIQLETNSSDFKGWELRKLPFYLQADYKTASEWNLFLLRSIESVSVSFNGKDFATIPSLNFQSTYFSKTGTRPYSVLEELKRFFAFPEEHFFVSLAGLEHLVWPEAAKHITFKIQTTADIPAPFSSSAIAKLLKLHCVPAANRYVMGLEPILRTPARNEYPLNLNANHFYGVRLLSIKQVIGRQNNRNTEIIYSPFAEQPNVPSYQIMTQYDKKGEQRNYLSLSAPRGSLTENEVISCTASVSNGFYPRQYLTEGDISFLEGTYPIGLNAKNLTRVSPYLEHPSSGDSLWQLISQFSFQLHSLCKVAFLKRCLKQCCWHESSKDEAKIEAITQIDVEEDHYFHRGVSYPLWKLQITLNETAFLGLGEVFLFGEMLYSLFLDAIPMHFVLELKLLLKPSMRTFLWPTLIGRKLTHNS